MDMPGMSDTSTGTSMPGMDMGDMDMGDMDMGSMAMYFNFVMPFTVVFEGWVISDQAALIGSCFGVLALAAIYEIMKNVRQLWAMKILTETSKSSNKVKECSSQHTNETSDIPKSPKFWVLHFSQSILHMIQVFLAYLIMLIVMTYNVWLVISAIVGAGVGYLLAGGLISRHDPACPTEKDPINQKSPYRKSKEYAESSLSSTDDVKAYENRSYD